MVLNPTNIDVALPTITRQPVPRSIVVGNPVQFDVAVEGSKPFTYQWQKNTANINGETNAVLSFDAVKAGDAANYRIVVSNKFGGATSLNAALKVVAAAAVPLNLGDTGNTDELLGVGFLNTDVGAVVGRKGTVLFTLNGGLNWTRSNTGVENDIYAVFFVEGATFIAGANGLLCVSYDLGGSWKAFDTGTLADFRALYFTGPNLGFAVGTGGTICRYNGTLWEVTPSGTNADFNGVHGRGSGFWAVGSSGTICVYRNGTWAPQNSGVTAPTFYDVSFQTDTFGIVVGSGGTVCATRNGGASWATVGSGTERDLRGVSFASSTTLFITGDHGTLLQSTDGAISFAIGGGGGSAGFRGLSYRDGTGYFADSAGRCHGFTVLGVAVNNPPAVGIVAPVETLMTVTNVVGNATNVVSFNLPRTNTTCVVLPVTAVASDLGGSVARIRLYANGVLLADGTGAQLNRRWTNGVPGLFELTAVAIDNRGAVGVSAPVRVVFVPPAIRTLVPLALVDGHLELCLGGEDGKLYDVETSTDLLNWTRLARFGGTFPVWEYQDAGLVTEPQRFFRAVEVVP